MSLMVILLGIVVSIDGLAAALAYGARRIRLTPLAACLVSLSSAVLLWLAMQVGQFISSFLPPMATQYLGALLLLTLGCYLLYQNGKSTKDKRPALAGEAKVDQPLAQVNLRAFGLVVQILRDPTAADLDQSGTITWQESWLLGLALSLDSFGVGIGAAMTGLAPNLTALIAGLATLLSLLLGWELGYRLQHRAGNKLVHLPGIILICLGIIDIFRGH